MQSLYGFDRRRVNGPEWSVPPPYESTEPGPSSTRKRGANDIRPIFLKTGLVTQANGSAYIETENVKIACAVYGPRQSKSTFHEKAKLNVEVKYAPFALAKRRNPMKEVEDRPTAVQVQQAIQPSIRLELFPKSTIDVFITVIEEDGEASCIASSTVAASAALADAGFEMLGLVASCAACTTSVSSASGESDMEVDENSGAAASSIIRLDPDLQDAKTASATFLMACIPALGTVTNLRQTGTMTGAVAAECLDQCLQKCGDIHGVMVKALVEGAEQRKASQVTAPVVTN
ncbi:ribosomal protein S5 domain 2-like protein [Clavulina sp. PMI_390]|nr:ribosomal protein S5 domain 2-like protein [Clavulina sp. PMI_390]